MASSNNKTTNANSALSMFEEPWVQEQVNGHIFFGLISKLKGQTLLTYNYYIAAVLWVSVKITFIFASFVLFLNGIVGLFSKSPGASYLILLAIIVFPSIEFVGCVRKYQKVISLLRLILASFIIWHTSDFSIRP